ncbi:MAG: signal peptidase I [archaeon]
MNWKQTWKKTWHFIWHDDSMLSWIVNVILAFVLIKFIIYPGLGLAMGTQYPVVAVVSSSMEHDEKFFDWWNTQEDFYLKNNITDVDFRLYPFINGFNKGDIMVLVGTKIENIEIGDVIVYQAKKPYPIIHRVISIRDTGGELYFETKGDNNKFQIRAIDLDEKNVSSDSYIGRAVFRIPFLGYIKIWFVNLINWIGLNIF